ncbi:MAG: hypothetical protein Q4B09_08685 [Lachnospiraceae bacterium]|nr:hypothetical protein [Lachnospiraceae bacterium]
MEQPLKEFSQRCQKQFTYFGRSTLHGPFPEAKGKPVQRVTITFRQRFGASTACFRKLQEGYRLFFVRTTDANSSYLPSLTNQGLENRINDILEGSSSVDCFDRLLNQEETKAFLSELEESRPEDNEIWNDAYGSASMQISILYLDGTEENINKTSKYAMRLLDTADELATVGLDPDNEQTDKDRQENK